MGSFLSAIIFVFPGLMMFYWIQWFGFTPATKYQGTEMVAISSSLWIPINICFIGIYDLISFIYLITISPISIEIKKQTYSFKMPLITKISDLVSLSNNVFFIIFYVTVSLIISFWLAKHINGKTYEKVLDKINKIRKKNGKAPFSNNSTVWDEEFTNNDQQIVGICRLGNPRDEVIGVIKNVSRPLELEHDIVLQNTFFWESVVSAFNISVDQKFVDTKSGIVIKIYDLQQADEASKKYMHNLEIKSNVKKRIRD